MVLFNKNKTQGKRSSQVKYLYQYSDGSYLPESSQPNQETGYKISAKAYTPHLSTRYINVFIGNNGKAQRKGQNGKYIDCDKELPEIYYGRENCCGCTACYAICPVQAIIMLPDEEGFLYPIVDAGKCIRCYKCLSVCVMKKYKTEG